MASSYRFAYRMNRNHFAARPQERWNCGMKLPTILVRQNNEPPHRYLTRSFLLSPDKVLQSGRRHRKLFRNYVVRSSTTNSAIKENL